MCITRLCYNVWIWYCLILYGESCILWKWVHWYWFIEEDETVSGLVEVAADINDNSIWHPAIILSIVFCQLCIILMVYLCCTSKSKKWGIENDNECRVKVTESFEVTTKEPFRDTQRTRRLMVWCDRESYVNSMIKWFFYDYLFIMKQIRMNDSKWKKRRNS